MIYLTVDEAAIHEMVHSFYDNVRADPLLGPVFHAHIDDWGPHLETMCDFWSSVLLGTRRFRGNPRGKHAALPELRSEHFDRWLALFATTTSALFSDEIADDIMGRARRMRMVLESASGLMPT